MLRSMRRSLFVGFVAIAISVAAFWLGGYWAIGFIGAGALVLLWEFHKMLRQEVVRSAASYRLGACLLGALV